MGVKVFPDDWWLTEDGLMMINSWARDGMMIKDICEKIGVSADTFWKWRKEHPELREAITTSKELVNYKVENALLKRALGFTSTEIKVTLGKKVVGGETYQVLKETTTKQIAPDVTACLAWLNNRNPENWRRNRDRFIEDTDVDRNVNITIVRGKGSDEQLGKETNQAVNFDIGAKNKKATDNERDPALDEWPEDWEEG